MRKKTAALVFFSAFFVLSSSAVESQSRILKLRFFKGDRGGGGEALGAVSSSYLQSTVTARIRARYQLSEELEEIRRIFNLAQVDVITEVDLDWEARSTKPNSHILRINGSVYLIKLTPLKNVRYRIEIFQREKEADTNLLDTEIILPDLSAAVFGFEDAAGIPYFVSLHRPETVEGEREEYYPGIDERPFDQNILKNTVHVAGEISPPRLIRRVEPIYPEIARAGVVQGIVILEAVTNPEGRVIHTRILQSKDPHLSRAAVEAIKKWEYEPFFLDGQAKGVIFTVTCRFKLRDGTPAEEYFGLDAVVIKDRSVPKLIKKVEPSYPEEARRAGVSGSVELEIRISEQGDVEKMRIVNSESSLLNQAAGDAVVQWKYSPYLEGGIPKPAVFKVNIIFKLSRKEQTDRPVSIQD